MKFGIFYEHQLPRPWTENSEHQLLHEALEQVELADRLGIDYAWEVEHHFLEEYSHSSAPEVFLAACSQRTKSIRLGHGIVLMPPTYNHPARVAERVSTLDIVSNGRVDWGTGESSSRSELEGFGVDPDLKREMWTETVREAAKMMCTSPYPGYEGEFFSMPHRDVVPKPMQKPHPPIWVACSNRATIRLAGRLGIGALTFAFIDEEEARYWVNDYYTAFKNECEPIGQAVNPNVAIVTGFMAHEDSDEAIRRGIDGFQFFGYGLSHFYSHGTHVPGGFDLWQDYLENGPKNREPVGCIGNPAQIRETISKFEDAGVDQVVFIQQGGKNLHEHICESLEMFSDRIMPEFKDREQKKAAAKAAELEPYVEAALERKPPIRKLEYIPPLDAYPVMREKLGIEAPQRTGPSILDSLIGQEKADEQEETAAS